MKQTKSKRRPPLIIGGQTIAAGTRAEIRLKVSETYFGDDVSIHLRVIRAKKPGPAVFVTAAIHGDELNGVGVVHELLCDPDLELVRGTLVLVPVCNVLGFEANERYLPDRRDLNRSFPGSPTGSLASRIAHTLFENVVRNCDLGIDLHTAAIQRTNYPNVRGRLADPAVKRLAEAFGAELIMNGDGPEGSFRREAGAAGCPTICVETGEPWKMEPAMVQFGVRGVRNVLIDLGMMRGEVTPPPYQTRITRNRWLRAKVGGILRFHVAPGQIVRTGQDLASNFTLLGEQRNVLSSPCDGIVLGMTTLPTVKPGEPVCHIGEPAMSLKRIEKALAVSRREQPEINRARRHLATSIHQVAPTPELGTEDASAAS
ncbi:succinylglutamate desuccinylase/aspartoacylase family protein [Synoicihabitans lomoniglobus]|uniref:Succinylglutamate desuccinylase/aspartoacylase family protein n=1 Tax=Synoicihabitans lomoniglobus TaxID=2909285 RepID=A0AAE9ZTR1_9BACT|nr:succinylglutamate desuccinylase/aspartoacylase family protein [Opitutaceae bacterium LMO-M01]WED63942.1 succinylglutamate desuccinylase/aspartoacylase family protein [Opitutaceae bacterium LMO-M01]